MKNFKTKKEMNAYYAARSLESYHRMKADPKRYKKYLERRRKYEKKRYRDMMAAFDKAKTSH